MREIIKMEIVQDMDEDIFTVTTFIKDDENIYEFLEDASNDDIYYRLKLIKKKIIPDDNSIIMAYFNQEMFEVAWQSHKETQSNTIHINDEGEISYE